MSSKVIGPDRALAAEATLVDVRSEASRIEFGTIPGSIIVGKTDVAQEFGVRSRNRSERIIVFCGSVDGSGPVVDELEALGYTDVAHVEGGFPALRDHGAPIEGA